MCKDCKKNKIQRIAEGWKNTIRPTQEVEDSANPKEIICSSCKYIIILVTIKGLNKGICKKCYCPTHVKTRSTEEPCPIGKF